MCRHVQLLLASLTLTASLAMAGCASPFQPGPDVEAKAWMQALAAQDGQKLSELTCTAMQGQLEAGALLSSGVLGLAGGLFGSKPRMNVDALQYHTTDQQGNRADVYVTGQLRVSIAAFSQAQSVNFTMPMLNEQGHWRYCSR